MPTKNKSLVNILGITSQSPRPVDHPTVDAHLQRLDALSRSTECIRYSLLSIEYWISPDGTIREWLRRNLLVCAWMIVPAICVMPVVGLILWQLTGWFSMLTGIVGKIMLILVLLVVLRIVAALFKR